MTDAVLPPSNHRLVLVDGYAIIYRALFALTSRPLMNSHGENTSAIWGVANFLRRLISEHRPEYLGWVHDSGLSYRTEQYPGYKATREKLSSELEADFNQSVKRTEQLLGAYRIPVVKREGYEADDVIGTLAAQGVSAGLNVVIVSGDKDFQQLIGPHVWLLNPGRGGPGAIEEQWVGLGNERTRLGVAPSQVTDYLALVGDSVDNVPGVRGIGPKTAVELIKEFGSLEEILNRTTEIKKERIRQAIEEQAANARLSKLLVTIRKDVDVTLDLDSLFVKTPDAAYLRQLFQELEFGELTKASMTPGATDVSASVVSREAKYETVRSIREVEEIVNKAKAIGHICVGVETMQEVGAPESPDPIRALLVGLVLGLRPGEVYYLPLRHRIALSARSDHEVLRESKSSFAPDLNAPRPEGEYGGLGPLTAPAMRPLRELLTDVSVEKIVHNGKHHLLVLRREEINLSPLAFDTMVSSYVLDSSRPSHALPSLAIEYLDHLIVPSGTPDAKGNATIGLDMTPMTQVATSACVNVDVTLRLATIFSDQLRHLEMFRLFNQIEMPLVPVLAEMEWEGIRIDLPVFAKLKAQLAAQRDAVMARIYDVSGEEFNINSNVQLRRILFEKLRLPIVKRTKTGPSTDATVLERLADEGHELPVLLMEYRELAKLQNTYIDTLPELVNPHTGRLHTTFNQTVAATGRLSSSNPNLQNIPVRRELGRQIRSAFIPREGWMMLCADYSQIELRLLAHLSEDTAFVEGFKRGVDIHQETAALIFDVSKTAVTSEMRMRAKTINFATLYGQGARALSRQLHVSQKEGQEFIDQYFERFAGVRRYLDSSVESARKLGYAETIFGRRRYIPELADRNLNIRLFGERTAQNTPIQGSAADLIKIAMVRIAGRMKQERFTGHMVLQVHDELVFEGPLEEVGELGILVKEEMESAVVLNVPLVVQVSTGCNWMEAKA
jgi:DNA polymerase I